MLADLRQDIRYAARTLRRQPGFTVVALLTLALGIGANTAVFSVVDGIMLSPLPYPASDRLVAIWPGHFASTGELDLLQGSARSYDGTVAAFSPGWGVTLAANGEATQLAGARTSDNFFDVLGVRPQLGRTFTKGESAPGVGNVVLLSDALWRNRFRGDPSVIGRSIVLDGTPLVVIGIMPPSFLLIENADLWMPLEVDPSAQWYRRGGTSMLVGRLRSGATAESAQRELASLVPTLRQTLGFETSYGADASVKPLRDALVGDLRITLLVLLGAVGFIVLIAGANVGNLLLARTIGRRHEIALRTAIGASRGRVLRQLLTESCVVAVAGGVLGLALAAGGVRALKMLLPATVPRISEVGIDLRVLVACALVTIVTSVLVGLAPALVASRTELGLALRAGRGAARGSAGGRVRGALVVAEVALALVLVIGASLMIQSMWRLMRVEPGFDAANVLTMRVQPTGEGYDSERRLQYFLGAIDRLGSAPGVVATGAIQHLPLSGFNRHNEIEVEGQPRAPGAARFLPGYRTIAGDYFRAMRIPLIAGRTFGPSDLRGTPGVVIVSDAFARQVYGDAQRAVGRRIRSPGGTKNQWATIVGVVGSVRHVALASTPDPEFYLDERQYPQASMALVVRTAEDPMRSARSLHQLVAAIDRAVPISDLRTMDALVARSLAQPRVVTILLFVFALVGLVLGAVGIYGVVSYAVGERVREIGIRIALGAASGSVVRMVVRAGLQFALAGIVLGLLGAAMLTRALQSLVFGVSTTDAATFALLSLFLLGTAALASWIPARRAARVDPMRTLRGD